MRVRSLLALALALGMVSACSSANRENKLPDAVKAVLDGAEKFELYSLDPDRMNRPTDGGFHGWKVLGKTEVKDKATRQKLIAALLRGIAENDGTVAGCFNPRHGIRAVKGDQTADLVICFQCYSLGTYLGKQEGGALTTASPQPVFNKVLKDANVPLPKQPED